ncbi:MAG: NCS2 family permease [Lactobacillaceae bacterium]|jgi:AGZA family xanthine/uracil permease-like MFS transporter|nr:NCS2 family permease [Lactobacillaceae bacterium]
MEAFFKLKANGTTISKELFAGLTTFFAMSYILFVNPTMLSQTGMPFQGVFLATIIATIAGTLIMGLFANVPYAQAPAMGLNAFFTYTVCFALGYTWQEALAMVFICGIINIIVTVSRLRKAIIQSIPVNIQYAIGGGIGIFVAYVGIKATGLLNFTADPGAYTVLGQGADQGKATITVNSSIVPALANMNTMHIALALVGLLVTTILVVKKVRGAFFLGIITTTLLGIPFGVVHLNQLNWTTTSLGASFHDFGTVFGAVFSKQGLGTLFSNEHNFLQVLMTIFAFSLADTFDTIGTFIGTGKKSGIFTAEDEAAITDSQFGFKTKMDRALLADAVATSIGAVIGTSNTTTYVESAAGIGEGGRTGLTSVFVSIFFFLTIFLSPIIALVPAEATAAALIIVGVMMMFSFAHIDWNNLEEAIPAFFASVFMGMCYSISDGIAAGFIFYTIIKVATGKIKEVHPIIWATDALFIINFIILAVL